MPKSTKRFTISDSRLNSHKFRMLTSGADLTDFMTNPIMYWMHIYPSGESAEELLPIGFWDDIKIEGDKITAIPNFDDSDAFAMKIYHKVEHGTLRACSAGAEPKPNGLSANPVDMLPGQTLPTFTHWWLREASICDRGSNAGAVALRVNGVMVTLSNNNASDIIQSLQKNLNENMKLTNLTAGAITAMLTVLKLDAESATEAEVTAAVEKLVKLSGTQVNEITKLKAEVTTAETKATEFETKLAETVNLANTAKITEMVSKAETDRKITKAQVPQYVKLAESDFETTKEILDGLTPSPNIAKSLETQTGATSELAELSKLSYAELDKKGKLVKLKALDETVFKEKFKTHFGKEYSN